MKEVNLTKAMKALFAAALVPFITACNGGGGGALLGTGSLFSGLATDQGTGPGVITTGDEIPALTNPEPASMLLIGSGMAIMAYHNNKKKA